MPLPAGAPEWANQLVLAYESGAHSQFILYGNVHDRLPVRGSLLNLAHYIEQELLAGFQVIFSYDLGNGLRIERGAERVQQWGGSGGLRNLPREPLAAVEFLGHYLRYLANLRALERGGQEHVACILRGADQLLPAMQGGYALGGLASLVKDWASESPYCELPFASFLIVDNLSDLHGLVAFNPRVYRTRIPLPARETLQEALRLLQDACPNVVQGEEIPAVAAALVGVTVAAVESLVKIRAYQQQGLCREDWAAVKKRLVESDTADLVEFIESKRTLADYHGQQALKDWLRLDMALWQRGDTRALPMGYLFCGPVGTGKTFLVECLAGEAAAPVVKLKNFRDRWVGSSEGNLEKIFRLIEALGRCMVFIDEADQVLGRRQADGGDSGLSGRLYAMIAQAMGDTRNRGRVIWILASSRPDLIEVDLKRPGRVDVKVPLLPTTTTPESAALLQALCRRFELALTEDELASLEPSLPTLLTPGAAEALAVKAYRLARTSGVAAAQALRQCLDGYQPPVPEDVLRLQMRLAIREATDLEFVPAGLRHLGSEGREPA